MASTKITGALDRIASSIDVVTKSEAKVARWILENPREVLSSTIGDVARASATSTAAVSRLCKSIDIDGFPLLKVLLTADFVRQEDQSLRFTEITSKSSFDDILHQLELGALASIQETVRETHEQDVSRIVDWIRTSRRVIVFGIGASGIVARDFYQKLLRMGLSAVCPEDFHQAASLVGQSTPDDLLFAISYSGLTSDVLEVAEIARARGTNIVGITHFNAKNPLRALSTIALSVISSEPPTRVGATHSIIGSLMLIDIIVLHFANRYFTDVYENLAASRAAVMKHKPSAHDP